MTPPGLREVTVAGLRARASNHHHPPLHFARPPVQGIDLRRTPAGEVEPVLAAPAGAVVTDHHPTLPLYPELVTAPVGIPAQGRGNTAGPEAAAVGRIPAATQPGGLVGVILGEGPDPDRHIPGDGPVIEVPGGRASGEVFTAETGGQRVYPFRRLRRRLSAF